MTKGVFEVQFNWIFVLIAGGIILFFFLTFIGKQKASSDTSIQQELISKIDTLLITTEQSYETYKDIRIVSTTLTFSCDLIEGGIASDLRIGSFSSPTRTQVLFAPAKVTGDHFQIWTRPWNQPYRIVPFMYLSTPTTLFVIINDTGFERNTDQILALFPPNVTVQVIQRADVGSFSSDYQRTIMIYFSEPIDYPSSMKDGAALLIEGTSVGNITFYKKDSFLGNPAFVRTTTQAYIGAALLLGALISADDGIYACNLQKAMERFGFMKALNLQRMQNLSSAFADRQYCATPLAAAVDTIGHMPTNSMYESFVTIEGLSALLAATNEDLVRGARCPLVY